jgi:Phage tail sheath protein FI
LRFAAQSPPLAESLPRMDVAVFVGFAAQGPVNQPVVVEDSAQFASVFGADAPLCWDAERGAVLRAYLGAAVRDFFRQGGKRCWVIRVARAAKYNYFPIHALLERRAGGEIFPAFARASSQGSWSDALRVGASLQARPIEVTHASFTDYQFELSLASPDDVQTGDLLRFKLRDEDYSLFCVVESVQAVEPAIESTLSVASNSAKLRRAARRSPFLHISCSKPLWHKTSYREGPRSAEISATAAAIAADGSIGPPLEVRRYSFSELDRSVTLQIVSPLSAAPEVGARLLILFGSVSFWLTVEARSAVERLDLSPLEITEVSGRVERWRLPRPTQALLFDHEGISQIIDVTERPLMEAATIRLDCSLALADAPDPGTVMRVDFGTRHLWLTVGDVSSQADSSSPAGSVQISGQGFWILAHAPALAPGISVEAERLTFALLARESSNNPIRLSELGFDGKHPRYWGDWPTDDERYQAMKTLAFTAGARSSWADAHERFPLAGHSRRGEQSDDDHSKRGERTDSELYLPLAMPLIADRFSGAIKQPQSPLERDGLAAFDADLFLDSKLIESYTEDILAEADHLRYQSTTAHSLRGIHAALDIEEATIIAVPDAVHRGWKHTASAQPKPLDSEPVAHPEWWRFLECNPAPSELPTASEPLWGNFLNCDLKLLAPPILRSNEAASAGTIALAWSGVEGATRYVVEESRSPAWDEAETIYSDARNSLVIYGRSAGDFYYRVRAEADGAQSEWSNGIGVRTIPATQWQVQKSVDYEAGALVDVHRALLRLCAARGDLFAALALPEHYREDDAITHAEIIRPSTTLRLNPPPAPDGEMRVAPLSPGEERAASYGALYHPWLVSRRDDQFEPWQSAPPDGAACGVMAARALVRGAWIAPANELLRGVVALSPPLKRERWQELQDAQVNIFRHEPRGFLSLSADTLSRDPDLRPINVRRLLILLRRLALRLGATYVFEPNDDSFRRLVQRGFEETLDQMFARGAFAGRTAATSYQVVTDNSINTPASVEQGRFVVELRVAPSLPLTFITIRMTQTNDRSFVTEG